MELFFQNDPKTFCKLKRCKGAGGMQAEGLREKKLKLTFDRKTELFFCIGILSIKIGEKDIGSRFYL